jgi:hypothetical protein
MLWLLNCLKIRLNSCNGRKSGRLDIRKVPPTGHQIVRKIQPINDLSLYLAQVSADERLVGAMAQLMGDTPVLMEEKLNYIEPLPEPVDIEAP